MDDGQVLSACGVHIGCQHGVAVLCRTGALEDYVGTDTYQRKMAAAHNKAAYRLRSLSYKLQHTEKIRIQKGLYRLNGK